MRTPSSPPAHPPLHTPLLAVIAFGNKGLDNRFPLGGSHTVAIATETELQISGQREFGVDGEAGGWWRAQVRVWVRLSPLSQGSECFPKERECR